MKYTLLLTLLMIVISSSSFADAQAQAGMPFPYGALCCAAKGEADDSRISFVDVYGNSGVFEMNIETKEIKEIFIKSGKYFSVDPSSLFSGGDGLYLTYLHCQDSSNCYHYLSFINQKDEEEVLLKSKYPHKAYLSPVPSPDNRYVAVIEKEVSRNQNNLVLLNQDNEIINILEISDSSVPMFEARYLWSHDGKRLYISLAQDDETTFYAYHIDLEKLEVLVKSDSMNVYYAYPFPVDERYIYFLATGKNAQENLIAKYDIARASLEVKNINDVDIAGHDKVNYPVSPFMSKLPEGMFFVTAAHKISQKSIFYIFDKDLNLTQKYVDASGRWVSGSVNNLSHF